MFGLVMTIIVSFMVIVQLIRFGLIFYCLAFVGVLALADFAMNIGWWAKWLVILFLAIPVSFWAIGNVLERLVSMLLYY